MNAMLSFIAFVICLFLYLWLARSASKARFKHPDQFFLSKSENDSDQFAASQIGYALQMATVYPFFIFAVSGMWWLAVWNTLFFALGICLLYYYLPKFMTEHSELVGSSTTLHAFIANLHGAPKLRTFTALMSVIGFTGLVVFEIVWGARVLRVLFNGNSSIYYLAIVILGCYLVFYLWLGGQRGTIATAQIQVLIAYLGLHAAIAWMVFQPVVTLENMNAAVLLPIVVILGLFMLFYRLRLARKTVNARPLTKVLNIFIIVSLVVMLGAILIKPHMLSIESLKWKPIDMSSREFIWEVIAFAVLPLFFQFVDMTTWQRMASLADKDLLKEARKGLMQYLIESPLSWVLPVLLGVGAPLILGANITGDSWDAFIKRIIVVPGILGTLLSILVVCGIGAIFLSTADEILSAVGYSVTYDIYKRTSRIVDQSGKQPWIETDVKFVLEFGRKAMAWCLGIVIACFVFFEMFLSQGDTILGLFLAFFTPMVTFAPAILVPAVTRRVACGRVAGASIGIGSLLGIAFGIISAFKGGIWQWLCVVVAFGASWTIYLSGFWLCGPRKIGGEPKA